MSTTTAHTTPRLRRGREALRELLATRVHDVREVADAAAFARWLEPHLALWARDPAFRQRCLIRDLRRDHPEVRLQERRYRELVALVTGTSEGARLARIEHECEGARKAMTGLARALEEAEDDARRQALAGRLDETRRRIEGLDRERREILARCDDCRDARRAGEELERLRASTGLALEEQRLAELLAARGRRSTSAGAGFESDVRRVVEDVIVPELVASSTARGLTPSILTSVRLGAARVELDLVVVGAREPAAEVLAVVEAKRNINDLAHGLRLRRENLVWLTGESDGIDASLYRTRRFPEGRFDRIVTHVEGETAIPFDRSSFEHFRENPPGPLLLVTREGPIWGMSAAALGRLAWRVATDARMDPGSARSLERLHALARSLAHEEETPDILRRYAADERLAQQILIL